VHDRARTEELFEFDYQLEMYKPAAKRQWGYFAGSTRRSPTGRLAQARGAEQLNR